MAVTSSLQKVWKPLGVSCSFLGAKIASERCLKIVERNGTFFKILSRIENHCELFETSMK